MMSLPQFCAELEPKISDFLAYSSFFYLKLQLGSFNLNFFRVLASFIEWGWAVCLQVLELMKAQP